MRFVDLVLLIRPYRSYRVMQVALLANTNQFIVHSSCFTSFNRLNISANTVHGQSCPYIGWMVHFSFQNGVTPLLEHVYDTHVMVLVQTYMYRTHMLFYHMHMDWALVPTFFSDITTFSRTFQDIRNMGFHVFQAKAKALCCMYWLLSNNGSSYCDIGNVCSTN